MTHDQSVQVIQSILAQLRPAIQGDGGDIELVAYQDGIVQVKLHGACVHCPISMYTLKLGVEEALKAQLPDVIEVVAVD